MPSAPSGREGTAADAGGGRRLAAIAFADIVGYSILMAEDETRTHARWMALLDGVIRPQATKHRGSVVKTTGDGVLVEFSSALDAVEWGRDVQHAARAADAGKGDAPPIALRIAVHLGDVIATATDIYGDGVNVAARLQEHAEPGGIVMSEAVFDLVRGTLGHEARDLGLLELKNFSKPVHAYALDPAAPGVAVPAGPSRKALPSIAVLPLQNLSGDPGDDYFADGIVEDIVVSLAGLRELLVIALSSTLKYHGGKADPREVGRALGVRYVLMGSVRRSGDLVRASTQLCDAQTGANLWADKTEIAPGALFDVQDRIVAKVVASIAPHVRAAELRGALRKRPESFTAYDHTLRALELINSLDKAKFLRAREFLEKAMAEDPNFAMPVAWAARWYTFYIGQGWSAKPDEDARKAAELAARAIDLDRHNALALATYGHLKSYLFHDYDSALVYFDRALAACPSNSLAWTLSSATLSYIGRSEQAVRHAEHGLRLSPFDQSLFHSYMYLALAHYANGAYEEAVKWGRMSASENPLYTANYRILAAALAALDRLDEARRVAESLMKLEPDFDLDRYERTRQPFRDPAIKARYIEHLRKAGLAAGAAGPQGRDTNRERRP